MASLPATKAFKLKLFSVLTLETHCKNQLTIEQAEIALSSVSEHEKYFKSVRRVKPNYSLTTIQGCLKRLRRIRQVIKAKENPPVMLFYSDL